jgi:hypothetical protein
MHVAAGYLTEELPLVCGMCHRRLCDITIFRGDVLLIRAPQREGIPEQQVPEGRVARGLGSINGGRPRDPNVRIFTDDFDRQSRFRIVHHHKRGGRGPLDRTVTAATLEKLYADAVASDQREVVLR